VESDEESAGSKSESPLRAVVLLFARLGFTAFGGPAAHIALMEEEVVRRRRWLTKSEFLDLISVTALIPGPNSTEMAIHIGHRVAGWKGFVAAGLAFILPSAAIVTLLAAAYIRYGSLPEAQAILSGMKPVLVAILFQAVYSLARTAVKTRFLAVVGIGALIAKFFGADEILVLGAAAAISLVGVRFGSTMATVVAIAASPSSGAASVAILGVPTLSGVFFYFLKVGSLLFGSGYVLFAFLRTDLVERLQWLSESQLLDAIAVGQMTPGPVFTAATFVGYLLRGGSGAALATLGIFLPAFFFVALTAPVIPRIRRSVTAARMLDGLNVASLAVLAFAGFELGKNSLQDALAIAMALTSAVLLIRFRLNSTWLLLAGALLEYFLIGSN
jgi:chromate transporter